MDVDARRPYFKYAAAAALVAMALLVVFLLLSRAVPLLGLRESHSGYFAPVWDADGRHVYVLKRETVGHVWGFGWEHFTPPARVDVTSDRFELLRVDSETGDVDVLHTFEGSPLVGRATEHYHGRIFNHLSAKLEATESGVEYVLKMNISRVPQSESWQLSGTWTPEGPSQLDWEENGAASTASPDSVLMNGVEVLTVPGVEAFPAGVLAVEADGQHRVLLQNDRFNDLYSGGVPANVITERSRRTRIERIREINRVRAELIEKFQSEGMNETEASLRAHDAMVDLGYFPKPPQVVATQINQPPEDLRVFEIPPKYFEVGLFQDLAKAIEAPGEEVPASTGTYLVYYDDQLGPELRSWIESGNDCFVVETGDRLYEMEVRRFD